MSDAIPVSISRKVFNDVYLPHLNNLSRTQIFYGGSSSGKSVFLAQRAVYDVLCGGRNYLIVRAVAKTLKRSVFQEIKKVIRAWGILPEFKINESDMTITCRNEYQILFAGLDDVEKLKSITPARGAITDIWVEEATEAQRGDVKQLIKRQRGGSEDVPKRITMSFNPILKSHWIYEDYFSGVAWEDEQTEYTTETLSILKTWYIHNRFLTAADVEDLLGEEDKYYRDVYTFGNWGVLGNVIFTNWRVDDLSKMQAQFTARRHGLDFGYSSDPAAMPMTHYDKKKKTIYIYGELYERGLDNEMLAGLVKKLIERDLVTCDSAEPKSIAELQKYGVNAIGAEKGKDSVNFGIQWLQRQKIVIDKRCINTRNEMQSYKWKEDKNGVAMRVPVEHNNHIIDGLRYAYEQDMKGTGPMPEKQATQGSKWVDGDNTGWAKRY